MREQSPIEQLITSYDEMEDECSRARQYTNDGKESERLKCTAADYRLVALLLHKAMIEEHSGHYAHGYRRLIDQLRQHLNRSDHYQFAEERNSLLEGMADEIERTMTMQQVQQDEEE